MFYPLILQYSSLCVLCVSFIYVFKIQISFQSFNILHCVFSAFHLFMHSKFKSRFNPLIFFIVCSLRFIYLCIQNSNLFSIFWYSSFCVLCVSFNHAFKFFSTFKYSSTVLTVPCLFANPLYYFLNVPQLPKFAFFATLKYSV